MSAFGKVFIFAYAFGDKLVVHDSWVHDGALQQMEEEQSFALEDSLHGREILAASVIGLANGKELVVTGSEDTFIKASEYSAEGGLKIL
jgi:hypothetical protein